MNIWPYSSCENDFFFSLLFFQDEHSVRTHNSNTAYASVTRILREASQILENGHYAAGHVRSVATRLEQTWKELATIFDERTTVLGN